MLMTTEASFERPKQRLNKISSFNKAREIDLHWGAAVAVVSTSTEHMGHCALDTISTLLGCAREFELPLSSHQKECVGPLFESTNNETEGLFFSTGKLSYSYDRFPTSYNQVLMVGTLEYCHQLLDKAKGTLGMSKIAKKIGNYIALLQSLQDQFKDQEELFFRLDLTYVENVFEDIEEMSIQNGLLPRLEDVKF